MENLQNDHLTQLDLELDGPVRQQLNDSAKWTRFISIVMFVACGILLLFGIIGGAALSTVFRKYSDGYGQFGEMGGGIIMLIVVFIAAVMGVIYYFLFNFSNKIKTALISESTSEFNAGLRSLKTFFIITTVFSILALLINIFNLF